MAQRRLGVRPRVWVVWVGGCGGERGPGPRPPARGRGARGGSSARRSPPSVPARACAPRAGLWARRLGADPQDAIPGRPGPRLGQSPRSTPGAVWMELQLVFRSDSLVYNRIVSIIYSVSLRNKLSQFLNKGLLGVSRALVPSSRRNGNSAFKVEVFTGYLNLSLFLFFSQSSRIWEAQPLGVDCTHMFSA